MGLDMFLERKKKNGKTIEEIRKIDDYEEYKKEFAEIAYWRKANMIHNWMVQNIQDGVDDCNYYLFTKDKIIELMNKCQTLLNEVKLVDKEVLKREYFQDGTLIKEYGNGKVLDKPEVAEEILPTQCGFFFGSTDYDEWYYKDIEYTYNRLVAILEILDFDEYEVYYTSSW